MPTKGYHDLRNIYLIDEDGNETRLEDIKDVSSEDLSEMFETLEHYDFVRVVRCKDCKHFQYDVRATINGMPIIVGHEGCDFWGDMCKTKEDAYCSFAEERGAE